MTTRRRIIWGIMGIILVAGAITSVPNIRQKAERQRTMAALQSLPLDRVRAAAQAFAHDHPGAAGMVALPDLIAGGYLHTNDVQGLQGREPAVSVSTGDTNEFDPGKALVRVHMDNASDIVLLADGSVLVTRRLGGVAAPP